MINVKSNDIAQTTHTESPSHPPPPKKTMIEMQFSKCSARDSMCELEICTHFLRCNKNVGMVIFNMAFSLLTAVALFQRKWERGRVKFTSASPCKCVKFWFFRKLHTTSNEFYRVHFQFYSWEIMFVVSTNKCNGSASAVEQANGWWKSWKYQALILNELCIYIIDIQHMKYVLLVLICSIASDKIRY